MKKIWLTTFMAVSAALWAQGVFPVAVYTPNGTIVPDTFHRYDPLTTMDLSYVQYLMSITYPHAAVLDSATHSYNCHAYAWHMTEGGSAVWMGLYSNPTYVYWNDGSYVETTADEGSKVSYTNGNHSAVTTLTPDVFISKWGYGFLVQHHKDDAPYDASVLKYYKPAPSSPLISGPDIIASSCQATYTVSGLPSGASNYHWQVTGGAGSGLTPYSGAGTSFTVSRTGNLNDPVYATIQFLFTYSGHTFSVQKKDVATRIAPEIDAAIYDLPLHEPKVAARVGHQYYFKTGIPANLRPYIQQYQWELQDGSATYLFYGETTATDPYTFNNIGTCTLRLRVLDGCGWSRWTEKGIPVFP